MVDVSVSTSLSHSKGLASLLSKRIKRMLKAMKIDDVELSVLLSDDPTIQQLNAQYRHKNRPTDVLAFAQNEGLPLGTSTRMLGDIVISVDTARRQAAARGASLEDESTMLAAHGLLHLLGFDHHTKHHDRRMRARTDLLLSTV